jgi:RNA polymerase sigma-70 factor (ECF subfamily)
MISVSDEQIIGRVLKGQTQEYRELVRRYQTPLFRLAYRVLARREEAEDAVQEAFVKAFRRLDTCRDRNHFHAWLRTIVLRICLDSIPRECPSDEVERMLEAGQIPDDPVEAEVLKRAELGELRNAIAELPAAYRTAVVLRYQEELSHKEIAELLGESVAAVEVRLHRARKILAERLGVSV